VGEAGTEDRTDRELLAFAASGEAATARGGEGDAAARERELRRAVQDGRAELRLLLEQRAALQELDRDRDDHQRAVDVQAGRLGLVHALAADGEHDPASCVLCGQALSRSDPTAEALAQAAAELDAQITDLSDAARDISAAVSDLDKRIAEVRRTNDDLRAELEATVDADEAARSAAREAEQRAYLRGIIAEHLRVVALDGGDIRPRLKAEIEELTDQLEGVGEGLDPASVRRRVDDRLDAAAVNMTAWARDLGLEWADQGLVRIDRAELTVAIQTPAAKILLEQTGAGANHVGYHLVAHLALHDYFVSQQRPVPRFLFLDQPSLPFFSNPQDKDAAAAGVDWQAVKRFFDLTRDVVVDLGGALQVVITDHAGYSGEEWFERARVATWRGGERLVPDDWPEA
jgi:hypothetical protein